MLRKILALGTIALVCAVPGMAAGRTHRAKIYKGTIQHDGGKVSLTIVGSSVTSIYVSGNWTCDNGVVPISYTYTLRSRRGHPARISRKGTFRGNHLKFSSADLYNNMGTYSGSGSLSGTVKGKTVTGSVSVSGSTPDSYCGGGGRYTAKLTG